MSSVSFSFLIIVISAVMTLSVTRWTRAPKKYLETEVLGSSNALPATVTTMISLNSV